MPDFFQSFRTIRAHAYRVISKNKVTNYFSVALTMQNVTAILVFIKSKSNIQLEGCAKIMRKL